MDGVGLGSLPGTDFPGALRWVLDELGPTAFLPELPARGPGSGIIGRGVALLDGLGADLQPSGWRLTPGRGADQRRAVAQWRRDLDDLEEQAAGYDGSLRVAVVGPLTLAAGVSRPLGDLVLADHGARRELAASLASGVGEAFAEIARRVPQVRLTAQVDEPMLPLVLAGGVPTASGFSRHRRVEPAEAVAALRLLRDALEPTTADVVLHCCAPGLDLDVVRRSGIDGVSVDAGTLDTRGWDAVAQWLEAEGRLVLGVVPTDRPDRVPALDDVVRAAVQALGRLELDPALLVSRTDLSPACGLGLWTPGPARQVLSLVKRAAPLVAEQLSR